MLITCAFDKLHVLTIVRFMKSAQIPPSDTALNVRRFRERLRERGLVKKDVWILPEYATELASLEKGMREPGWAGGVGSTEEGGNHAQAWTLESIERAITLSPTVQSGAMEVEHIEGAEPSLRLRVHSPDGQDVDILLAVSGEQILVESYLWPETHITDAQAFNDCVLRTHKYLPLSTFSITDVAGVPSYTLFGSLNSHSPLTSVMFEIQVLAENVRATNTLYAEFFINHGDAS